MPMVFVHNVLMDITLIQINNVKDYLKIVLLLIKEDNVHNVILIFNLLMGNVEYQDP